jgi:hypothetical protein
MPGEAGLEMREQNANQVGFIYKHSVKTWGKAVNWFFSCEAQIGTKRLINYRIYRVYNLVTNYIHWL